MIDLLYLRLAKSAILSELDASYGFDKSEILEALPHLRENGASFVTLESGSDLRGCIGSIVAHRDLFSDIVSNAKAAAFRDPRFAPLSLDETMDLSVEVSLLSTPSEVVYSDFADLVSKVVPHKDGLILKHRHFSSTYLPQVWQSISDTSEFLLSLAYKAGANEQIFSEQPSIYRYRVTSIKKVWDSIEVL